MIVKYALLYFLLFASILIMGCNKDKPTSVSSPLPPISTVMSLSIDRLPAISDSATFTVETYLENVGSYEDSIFNHFIPITTWIVFGDSADNPSGWPDTIEHPFQFLGDSAWVDYMQKGGRSTHIVKAQALQTGKWIAYCAGGLHRDTLFNHTGSPSGFINTAVLFISLGNDTSYFWQR